MDLIAVCEAVLTSPWLLPVLVVLIAVDGPLPVLPSETLLMTATATAVVAQDVLGVLALFLAALLGSVLGDLAIFGLGRSSHRLRRLRLDSDTGLIAWVRRHLLRRPGIALVGARFVPGGRLISTAGAGRFGLSLPRFFRATTLSSLVWSCYMLLIGLALGPLTGGNPLLGVLAGTVLATVTVGAYALAARIRRARGVTVWSSPAN